LLQSFAIAKKGNKEESMNLPSNPRAPIEAMIGRGDLEGLLRKAGELHGHFCPYVALGVRAGYLALTALGIEQNLGMEEVLAIVETNNCFSDGIQVVTGCTFANNALVYRDLGKTAVTVAKRDGRAVRVALRAEYGDDFDERYPEAAALFAKIVRDRQEPTPEEQARLMALWAETSAGQLEVPAEALFRVEHLQTEVPAYAPILASATCSLCGERVMESRARLVDGRPACMTCAGAAYYQLDGAGIHEA
jgi:formylmethanofuran dehydrogenase subunit E